MKRKELTRRRKNREEATGQKKVLFPQWKMQVKEWVAGFLDPQKEGISPEKFREQELLREIREVCELLHHTQGCFQMTGDGDLLDSCIYQIEALHARYRYLLRQAKTAGISCSPFLPVLPESTEAESTSGGRRTA